MRFAARIAVIVVDKEFPDVATGDKLPDDTKQARSIGISRQLHTLHETFDTTAFRFGHSQIANVGQASVSADARHGRETAFAPLSAKHAVHILAR